MFHSSRTRFSLHKHGYYLFKAPSVPLITLSAGEADSIVQGETKLGTPDAGKKAEVMGAEAAGASKLRSDNQPLLMCVQRTTILFQFFAHTQTPHYSKPRATTLSVLVGGMINATRRWLRRNRTGFAIGFGVIGIGYIAGQYVLSKITEARERMAGDRIAKEKYVS